MEKKVFVAAYAMRKLFEAKKVSTSFETATFQLQSFPRTDNTLTPFNDHRFEKHFNLSAPRSETVGVRDLFNEIIHSRVFVFSVDETEATIGFLVCSEWKMNDRLLSVPLPDFVNLMRRVGNNYPAVGRTWRDKNGKWRSWQVMSSPCPGLSFVLIQGRPQAYGGKQPLVRGVSGGAFL